MSLLPRPAFSRFISLIFSTVITVAVVARMAQAAPLNDDFASATAIGGLNGTQSGSTATATSEPGEPLHAGFTGTHSVWFSWTAPQSGRWFFRTAGSSYDTTLAVYTGSALNALTAVVSNDDIVGGGTSSYVEFTAQAGAVYQVAIDGYQGANGNYTLNWQALLPPNDNFASATAITGAFGYRNDSNAGATAQAGEPNPGNSIWYRWTAPKNMQAVFSTVGSAIDTFLAAYTGSAVGSLTTIASNDNDPPLTTSKISFAALSGGVYYIQLTGIGGDGGNTTTSWSEEGVTSARLLPDISILASALNDRAIDQNKIPGRTLLRVSTATPNTGAGPLELRGAMTSPVVVQRVYHDDGSHDDQPAGSFTFHPTHGHLHFDDWVQLHLREVLPGDGVGDIVASGNKTSFAIIDLEPHDTGLPGAPDDFVYGGGLTQGISVGWRDVYTKELDDQWIDVTAVPPGDYWLEGVVDPEDHIEESDETNNANRILITYAGAAPPNNTFGTTPTSPTVLTGATAGTTGKTHLGTKQAGEPNHAGNAGGKSVWYRWTAPANGLVTLSTEGSDFDTLLAVYTGTAVGSLTEVASNDDADVGVLTSQLTFTAVSGTIYRIAVDGKNGAVGSCELAINPSSNNLFAASRLLSGATGTVTGSSYGATLEGGEPNNAGTGGKSVWFSWTAPSAGEASFDTEGSAFDTVLAVYTGSSVGGLTLVASDDNSSLGSASRVIFTAVSGTTYRIALDGHDGAAGIHTLRWSVSSTTVPYVLTHPESAVILLGGTANFNIVAGGSQPRQYQWWHNGAVLVDGARVSGANTPALSVYKLQPTDSGSYFAVVTNSLGTATSNNATLIAIANPRAIHADEVTADIGGVLSLPVGIQSQGDENSIQCTLTLDPAIFLAPRAFLGPDAEGGTINLDLSQAAAGRIGITVTLPVGQVLTAGHREIAVIEADVSPVALPGAVKPAGFVSVPVPPSASTPGGALLAAQTAAGSVTLVQVFPATSLLFQGDGSTRVILHGLRGLEYVVSRSDDLVNWEPFGQGFTDENGFVEAIDLTAGSSTHRFYIWSTPPPP